MAAPGRDGASMRLWTINNVWAFQVEDIRGHLVCSGVGWASCAEVFAYARKYMIANAERMAA